jgi:tRNA(Ile)-lysidine synthetase-like protein
MCSVVNDRREEKENTLVFSLDKIKGPVSVSFWDQKGRLDAGRGSRSLKRLFTDAAFSVREREETPVLYCGGAPIAIVGVAAERSLAEGGGPWWVVAARDEKE